MNEARLFVMSQTAHEVEMGGTGVPPVNHAQDARATVPYGAIFIAGSLHPLCPFWFTAATRNQ